jgi:hypothetical protein
MRYIYSSPKGGEPMNIGMNKAKRIAHRADKRDNALVLSQIGPGLPRQHVHHQDLVRQRHAYYHQRHEALLREQLDAS